jgi:hypothetical protein
MKVFEVKKQDRIYYKERDHALYCDLCEEKDVKVVELDNKDATQVCLNCIKNLYYAVIAESEGR